MATRFYLKNAGAQPISPGYDALWNDTASASRRGMNRSATSLGWNTIAIAETSAIDGYKVLFRMWVSNDQFNAYSFSGSDTWKLQIRGMESNPSGNLYLHLIAKVWENGVGSRGTLISAVSDDTELNNGALENRSISGVCQSVSMQDEDYIVLELGYSANNKKTSSYTGTIDTGDSSGTDLPENDSETSQYNPWFELSPNLSVFGASAFKPKVIIF